MRMRWRGFELPTKIVSEEVNADGTYAKFVVEPFERGYGITVGNSLRRVLLNSIEGSAPVAVKFEQVNHEFTAISGIYEDVTNIVLNIKGLLVCLKGEGVEVITVNKSGVGPVTAGDFETGPNVEIMNPEHLIATITEEKQFFAAEVTLMKGRGYKSAEELTDHSQPLGVIPLDATFSPVRRTRWTTEDTRVGQLTNYDRLMLEIWTNGTIKPEEALVEAASILRKHLNPFVKYFDVGPELEREGALDEVEKVGEVTAEDKELMDKLTQPVSILDPSVRAANCLAAEGLKTLFDLVSKSESDMLQVRNFGKTSLKEIKAKIAEMGLSFGMNIPVSDS